MPQADPQRVEQATGAYESVRDGDLAAFAAQSTPGLRPQLTVGSMAELRGYSAPGEPERSKVLSWRSNSAAGAALYEIVQQYEYPHRTVIVQVVMVRDNEGPWLIDGYHMNAVSPAQAKAASGFTLEGKSPFHYLVLIGVVVAPLACLVTAGVAAWRRRWGWMILSLFGAGQLALNWTTGEWQFQALNFSVLSAGFFKGPGPFDPWILTLALPIPVLLFWALRRDRPKAAKPEKGPPTAPPADSPAVDA